MIWSRVPGRLGGLLFLAVLPSCFVYDEDLLGEAIGSPGGGASVGGMDATGGGQGNAGGSLGGAGPSSGGGSPSGGGGTGSAGSGGAVGDGGSTSTDDCDAVGTTGAFTGVGDVTLIDDFEISWTFVNGEGFDGLWYAGGDSQGTELSPNMDEWAYEERACAPGNHALHVMASGYTQWGVSYDAGLWDTEEETPEGGISGFSGIVFWARSDLAGTALKIGLTDDSDPKVTREVNVPPLTTAWKQYKVPLTSTAFSGIDLEKVRVVQIVGTAAEEIDFWIDDLSFYEN